MGKIAIVHPMFARCFNPLGRTYTEHPTSRATRSGLPKRVSDRLIGDFGRRARPAAGLRRTRHTRPKSDCGFFAGRAGVRRPVSRVLFRTRRCGDDHSSGPPIAGRFSRPTRTSQAVSPAGRSRRDVPIWSCSRRGLPCRRRCRRRGGLLPHPFTLAAREREAVCFLWRFPSGRPGRKLSAAFSPWSPDFPRRSELRRDRPAV